MTKITVLKKLLKQRGRKGVTVSDFPTGYRLSARIYDLRGKGWQIDTTQKEPVAKYVYRGMM